MKKYKYLLIAALFAELAVSHLFAQTTISLSGTNGTINAGDAFTGHITLTISGNNSIGNVESVNFLLGTPATGPNAGASFFTITGITPTSPFNTANANPATATFGTAGDVANTGSTVTTNTFGGDVGVNAPGTSAASVGATGNTSFEVETITFQSAMNTPAGVYNFYATSGGAGDAQGSFIANSSDNDFSVDTTPTFTITINPVAVPEPSTWSLLGLGVIGSLGMTMLRRRRA